MNPPEGFRQAQTPQEATVALAFTKQAIDILMIANDFPDKEAVQKAAAAHLLLVFQRPGQGAATAVPLRRRARR